MALLSSNGVRSLVQLTKASQEWWRGRKISTFNLPKEAKEARLATEKRFMSPVIAAQTTVMSKVCILPDYKKNTSICLAATGFRNGGAPGIKRSSGQKRTSAGVRESWHHKFELPDIMFCCQGSKQEGTRKMSGHRSIQALRTNEMVLMTGSVDGQCFLWERGTEWWDSE